MIYLIRRPKKKRWLLEHKIKSIQDIYQNRYIAILHDDGDYTVLPSWWARFLTVHRFMKYITAGTLYVARKNPYLK